VRNSFFLVIPPQTASLDDLKLYEETILNQWILDLPAANQNFTTKLFYKFLLDLNKTKMSIQLRLDTLETLKPVFLKTELYLREKLSSITFPRGKNGQKTSTLLIEIEKEFTLGYWILVKALTKPRAVNWFQGRNTALVLQRMIHAYGGIIASHYMMRLPIPDWVWIDLHAVYSLSIQHKKQTVKVPDNLDYPSDTSTVTRSYVQILLFSLLETETLMQSELHQIYKLLQPLSAFVSVENSLVKQQALQCYLYVDEDSPPTFEEKEEGDNPKRLYLNFTRLYKALKLHIKSAPEKQHRFNVESVTLSFHILKHQEDCWRGKVSLETACFADRLDRFFAVGLESSYELQESIATEQHATLEYLGLSVSEKGLSCDFLQTEMIAIGSLVSFRKTSQRQNQRILGIVSRVKRHKQGSYLVEFDILPIATKIYAVSYRIDNDEEGLHQSLFYQGQNDNKKKWFIIINSYLLKEQDIIELQLLSKHFWVELLDKKNVGLGYWQFECKRVEKVGFLNAAEETKNDRLR
jgi:hypothetical protein